MDSTIPSGNNKNNEPHQSFISSRVGTAAQYVQSHYTYIDMTQISHPRRTRILPPSPIPAAEKNHRQQQQDALAARCRPIFERLRPQLIEAHYNWHIAIDPDTEQHLLDPTLLGITQKIREVYGSTNELKLTIFRLNDTGSCGRLWV